MAIAKIIKSFSIINYWSFFQFFTNCFNKLICDEIIFYLFLITSLGKIIEDLVKVYKYLETLDTYHQLLIKRTPLTQSVVVYDST